MVSRGRRSPARATPFVLRRALTQLPLLVAVLAVVVAGATLLGVCTLLLTTAQEQTLASAVRSTPREDVAVTASLTITEPTSGDVADASAVVEETTALVARAVSPFTPEVSVWLTSAMQYLPTTQGGSPRLAYLLDADTVADHAELDAGRWPRPVDAEAPREVTVPASAARLLGLDVGSEVRLTPSAERDAPTGHGVDLVVVGTFAPLRDDDDTWSRDRLGGAGSDPRWERLAAYGPFVVAPGTLLESGVPVDRLSVRVAPDLAAATAQELQQARAGVGSARRELRDVLDDRASAVVVRSTLPATVATVLTQQGVTSSGVLVVALVGWVLGGTALALAGRLLSGRRSAEHALLTARGAHRGRLVGHAVVESAALTVAAVTLAVPLSVLAYRALAALPAFAGSGVHGDARVTPALVVGVACGALVLAAVLVVPATRNPGVPGERRHLPGVLGRSGADVLLVGVAVLGYLQLRAHRVATGAAPDPVLVAAPVVCLVAGAVLTLRVLPWVARLAEGRAARSRGLVLPLAAWELARRPHSTAGAFLLVLATAAATFGVAFSGTWVASQQDQADASVGTDLAVGPVGLPALDHGRSLADATGGVVGPVTDRPIALGSRVAAAEGDATTRLLAIDTSQAAALLRGRLPDGATWADLTAGLAPATSVVGPSVEAAEGIRLTLTGDVTDQRGSAAPDLLEVTTGLVVEDEFHNRVLLPGGVLPLDGRPHELVVPVPAGGSGGPATVTVVALELELALGPLADVAPDDFRTAAAAVAVALEGEAATAGGDDAWAATRASDPGQALERTAVSATTEGSTTTVTTTTELLPVALTWADAAVVIVTAFTPDDELPVVVSRDLAQELDLARGDRLRVGTGAATLDALVTGVVPYVPSAPRGPVVLADHDALARAVLAQGDVGSVTDGWWVGDVADPDGAAAAVAGLGLGEPVVREAVGAELRDGPLRVPLRTALWVLVVAALVLALAGTAVHTASGLEARSTEVARLQGLGLSRRDVVTALLVQHGAVTLLVVGLGAALGALVSWTVGPLLAVSASGLPPVPPPLVVWPWPLEAGVLVVVTLGCTAVVAPVTAALVRRATVAHLRMDGGS